MTSLRLLLMFYYKSNLLFLYIGDSKVVVDDDLPIKTKCKVYLVSRCQYSFYVLYDETKLNTNYVVFQKTILKLWFQQKNTWKSIWITILENRTFSLSYIDLLNDFFRCLFNSDLAVDFFLLSTICDIKFYITCKHHT